MAIILITATVTIFAMLVIRYARQHAVRERRATLAAMVKAEHEDPIRKFRYMSPEQLRHVLKLDEKPKRPESFREWSAIPRGPFTHHAPISRANCPGFDSDDCTEQCHDYWTCTGKGKAS